MIQVIHSKSKKHWNSFVPHCMYVVSITWYINQPLVRLLLCIINPQSVWYHLHRFVLCNDLIQFLVGMFSFKSEYISPYSISTLPLNWTIYDNLILFLNCSTLTTGKDLVIRSAGLSTPAVWKGSTTLFSYCSQIQWFWMSMCFIQCSTAGFTMRNITAWLSEHSGIGPLMGNPISLLKDLSQAACCPVLANSIYSASPTDNVTVYVTEMPKI